MKLKLNISLEKREHTNKKIENDKLSAKRKVALLVMTFFFFNFPTLSFPSAIFILQRSRHDPHTNESQRGDPDKGPGHLMDNRSSKEHSVNVQPLAARIGVKLSS